jgi:hypothetical protein
LKVKEEIPLKRIARAMERKRALARIAIAVFFILIFLVLAGTDPNKRLDHDEHIFIASGMILSQSGTLPLSLIPIFISPIWS